MLHTHSTLTDRKHMKNNSFHFLSSLIFKGTVSLWEFFYNLNFLFHLIRLSRVKVSIAQSSVQQRSGLVEENQLEWHLVWFQESCKHLYLYMYACMHETLICFEQNSLNPQPKLLTAVGAWWWLLSSSNFLPLCCFFRRFVVHGSWRVTGSLDLFLSCYML